MSNRLAKVKQVTPELAERTDVQEVAKDIDKYASLASLASSEAGTVLISALNADVVGAINNIMQGYKILPHVELQGFCADLEAKVQLVRTLKRAATNLNLAEDFLEELTK